MDQFATFILLCKIMIAQTHTQSQSQCLNHTHIDQIKHLNFKSSQFLYKLIIINDFFSIFLQLQIVYIVFVFCVCERQKKKHVHVLL